MVRNLKSILSRSSYQFQQRLQTQTFSSSNGTSISSNLSSPQRPRKFQHFISNKFGISDFVRSYSNNNSVDTSEEVNNINLKFAEARDDIETALDSKETVYFNEEAECARDSVKEVLDMFEGLLEKVPEVERNALRRSMGLKMEQLKAELAQLNE
ncbi:embryogenesis-like protein [Impatiens glandulifera]|uniref:embryogenesis-like protein n=1 Tax=Impatiens glandulifera TaxID=253017 RepID=UPI001FB17EC2|nr:embryogenesis-like protein [Impatiens glandulifera]